ncbi:histidine phosphatase family protein [Scardovia wiggsiae]
MAQGVLQGRLVLLRHGQTIWSETGQYTGRTDIPLTQTGCIQAKDAGKRIREFLAGPGTGASAAFHVYVSPLKRAQDTAQLAGLGECTVDDGLAEFDYGPAEGRTRSQVAKAIGEKTWNIWDRGPLTLPSALQGVRHEMLPGYGEITINNGVGESAEMAAERTRQVIQQAVPALEAGEDVICVAHAHILRILATQWLGLQPEAARMFELGTARFCVLSWHHEDRVISGWNL